MLTVMNFYFILIVLKVYPYSINGPYVKICIPDVIKNINVKVFNLKSRTKETRHIEEHETCKCKCRLDGGVSNIKQRWNEEKCRCKEICKTLVIVNANVINHAT